MSGSATRRQKPLIAALGVSCAAYFALWACAPAAMLRPPAAPLGDERAESALGMSETVAVDGARLRGGIDLGVGWGLQYSYSRWVGRRFSLGGVVFVGSSSALGLGVQTRIMAITAPGFRLGLDVEGGFLYGAVGLPAAVRLRDGVWLYTAPGYGVRVPERLRVPVGLAINVGDHVYATPELSVGYGSWPNPANIGYDTWQFHVGIGGVYWY